MTKTKKQPTVIDYTLEQFMAEQKHREIIVKTLSKIEKLLEKFENLAILHDHRIKQLERMIKSDVK